VTRPLVRAVEITLPAWVEEIADPAARFPTTEARMRVAVTLAAENVAREPDGGPFGAALFRQDTGQVIAAGVNSVLRLRNSVLHAEVIALMLAHRALHSHSFAAPGLPALELVTSCEPCAMCLGATLWSGVRRLVCGATREDAEALGFDEGPVTDASYRHLEGRGVEVVRGVLREEARAVLARYGELGRTIY
jgi:tRNA(Arg) A34 adenosine deaminase TadA